MDWVSLEKRCRIALRPSEGKISAGELCDAVISANALTATSVLRHRYVDERGSLAFGPPECPKKNIVR